MSIPVHILSNGDYKIMVNMVTLKGSMIYSLKAYDAVMLTIRHHAKPGAEALAMPVLTMTLPWETEVLAENGG